VLFRSPDLALALEGAIARTMGHERRLERRGDGIFARFSLQAGETQSFLLERVAQDHICRPHSEREADNSFEATVMYWRRWVGQSRYRGRWREMVMRSALTLKLLTYAPTGALVAAPTTSLPEQLGGGRNWDYRYTWIRDAAFSLYGLLRLGFTEEAAAFMNWLTDRTREWKIGPSGPLQIMYGIDGRADLPEFEHERWEGYRGSHPVRIGNAAAEQRQLDIYGELIDSVYLFNKYGSPIFSDTWDNVRRIVDWLCENWDQADEGIWETRGGQKDFTYSRLMCWVALERSIRMNRARGLPGDIVRWLAERDRIYNQIMQKGWSNERQAFVQHYGSDVLDASVLLMPLTLFIAPKDPKWLSTLDAIGDELVSTRWSTATTSRRHPTACAATRARSRSARSGTSRRSRAPGGWTRRGWRSRRCSPTPTTSGCTRRRSARPARRWATSRRRSRHLALISAAYNLDRTLG
jgi:GH15 family glucan-1,4-alpha-glucosidase